MGPDLHLRILPAESSGHSGPTTSGELRQDADGGSNEKGPAGKLGTVFPGDSSSYHQDRKELQGWPEGQSNRGARGLPFSDDPALHRWQSTVLRIACR